MIIPKVSASNHQSTNPGLDELIGQLKHWSLFGIVALTDIESFDISQMEQLCKRIGGSVDLQIELKSPTESDALSLLNAGATSIICLPTFTKALSAIPADRFTHDVRDEEETLTGGDQTELKEPDAGRLAQLEMARIDCLVDSVFLDNNPQVIVDFLAKVLTTDRPDGLWSTLIVDPLGLALGLAYSNRESLLDALTHRRGTYWSRSRDSLWVKGATSGAVQNLIGIRMDCDRDCLRFQVTQDQPGFCHRNNYSCFGNERTIESVCQRLLERIESSDNRSFTKKLVNDPEMLRAKLLEEAQELSEADNNLEIAWEAADVLYFSLVKMLSQGVRLEQVHQELARRMNRVVRRKNKLENVSKNQSR